MKCTNCQDIAFGSIIETCGLCVSCWSEIVTEFKCVLCRDTGLLYYENINCKCKCNATTKLTNINE